MTKIYKNSYFPMYQQIANELMKDIKNRKFKPGDNIGTQKELVDRFKVSLITIRKAVQLLEEKGVVVKKQGKGTFVRDNKVMDDLKSLQGLSNIMIKSGLKPKITVLEKKIINTPLYVKKATNDEIEDKCIFISRLHESDNKPIGYAKIYLPLYLGVNLNKEELEKNTLYYLFEKKLKIKLGEGIQTIKATHTDKSIAKILNIEDCDVALKVERIAYDANKNIIEFIELFYKPEDYEFRVVLELSAQK